MPVAEGVDHENVDVGGHGQEILGEGGEHVPGVEVHEASDEVETEGCREGDDDDAGALGGEESLEESVHAFVKFDLFLLFTGEGADDEEEREDY